MGRCSPLMEHAIIAVCLVGVVIMFTVSAVLYKGYTKIFPLAPSNDAKVHPGALMWAHFNDPSMHLCKSSTCQWLSDYLDQKINNAVKPCENFNGFVCALHEEPFVATGMWNFTRSLRRAIENHSGDFGSAAAAGALKACVEGADRISDVILHREELEDIRSGCTSPYPRFPFYVSEKYFRENRNGTVKGFGEYLSQRSPRMKVLLSRRQWNEIPGILEPWVRLPSKKVSRSALCHLKERLNSTDDIDSYTVLWRMVYFSPFVKSVYRDLRKESVVQKPRLEACLDVIDDIFPSRVRSEGLAILKSAVPNYETRFRNLLHDAVRSLRNHFKIWLSGNAEAVLSPLDTVKSVFLDEATPYLSELIPALSTPTLYSAIDNSIIIPQGSLAVLLSHSSIIDSIFVPFLGADLLRSLLFVPNTTAWTSSDAEAWDSHRSCIHRQMNGSALVNDTVSSSIALNPLFVVYRDHVSKQYPKMVKINGNFTNEQLFFVLWAAGRCGGDADTVNAPLRNSERFTKAFRCSTGHGMVPEKRCPFWIR